MHQRRFAFRPIILQRLAYHSHNSCYENDTDEDIAQLLEQDLASLAKQFGVSDSAMTIRIRELELVRWP